MEKSIWLDDFIIELIGLESYFRRKLHFYKWIARFESLRNLTEKHNDEIFVKNTDKFTEELKRLVDIKLIKAKLF